MWLNLSLYVDTRYTNSFPISTIRDHHWIAVSGTFVMYSSIMNRSEKSMQNR